MKGVRLICVTCPLMDGEGPLGSEVDWVAVRISSWTLFSPLLTSCHSVTITECSPSPYIFFHESYPLPKESMYWKTVLTPTSRRRTPPPSHSHSHSQTASQRPGPTPYPYALANPALNTQFEFPSASSTPNGTPSGSEVDQHEQDGEHEEEGEGGVVKSGRAGNRRRQKYSRTRTGCLSCRTRRIKCDEARPVCKRCIIAKKTVSSSFGNYGLVNW
jgi:hypothetical protein